MQARYAYPTLERALRRYLAALRCCLLLLVCTACALGFSAGVRAQEAAGSAERATVSAGQDQAAAAESLPPEKALKHYERGREHYLNGRYRDALLELEIAVNIDPNSLELVYNVARVYELLGEIDHSIAFYRRYLEMLPAEDVEERQRTTTTLQRLEGARHVIDQAPKPAEATRRRGVADAPFWTLATLSAAALAGGATTGVLALMSESKANDFRLGEDGSEKRRDGLVERTERLALASDVMLLAGVSLGVTAALVFALRERTVVVKKEPARAPLQVGFSALPHGAFFALGASL